MNIWWIRRDLRLEDNQALTVALNAGTGVVPAFILDEHLLAKPAEKRHGFLFEGLRALDEDLHRLGSRLIIRRGDPVEEIANLAAEIGAGSVFAEQDVSPYSLQRDSAVAAKVNLILVHGLGIHPISLITKSDGSPYTVFTPFSRAWKALPASDHVLPAPASLPAIPGFASVPLPLLPAPDSFPAGELEGRRRLNAFLAGPIFDYEAGRDRPDLNGTSSLSPYLRFGMISARKAAAAARQASRLVPDAQSRAGCESWLNEIIWREFYQSILYHFPYVLKTAFKPSMRSIRWRNAPEDFQAWKTGLTGYPMVDAGMRQLAATGWMHNRSRMITASFLVKHLLINWQEGESWFMQMLVDGDPASNNGGWQWTAGTGTDAAPYFRVFNPILQGQKFDPDGIYIRRWVPELRNVSTKYIHAPWEMPESEQKNASVIIGRNYPAPIVDHQFARQRVLKAYSNG